MCRQGSSFFVALYLESSINRDLLADASTVQSQYWHL